MRLPGGESTHLTVVSLPILSSWKAMRSMLISTPLCPEPPSAEPHHPRHACLRQVGSTADEFWIPLPGQGGDAFAIVFEEEAQRIHAEGHVHVDRRLLPYG